MKDLISFNNYENKIDSSYVNVDNNKKTYQEYDNSGNRFDDYIKKASLNDSKESDKNKSLDGQNNTEVKPFNKENSGVSENVKSTSQDKLEKKESKLADDKVGDNKDKEVSLKKSSSDFSKIKEKDLTLKAESGKDFQKDKIDSSSNLLSLHKKVDLDSDLKKGKFLSVKNETAFKGKKLDNNKDKELNKIHNKYENETVGGDFKQKTDLLKVEVANLLKEKEGKISLDESEIKDKKSKIKIVDFRSKDELEKFSKENISKENSKELHSVDLNSKNNKFAESLNKNFENNNSDALKVDYVNNNVNLADVNKLAVRTPLLESGVFEKFSNLMKTKGNDEIVKSVKFVLQNNNQGEISLMLRPAELGRVLIKVSMKDNVLGTKIIVDNPAAREFFSNNQNSLTKNLEKEGFNISSFDVAYGDNSGNSGSGFSGGQQQNSSENFLNNYYSGVKFNEENNKRDLISENMVDSRYNSSSFVKFSSLEEDGVGIDLVV